MSRWWWLVIIGILLRIVLMVTAVHPDLRGHYLGAKFMAVDNDWWGVYDHLSRLPRTNPLVRIYGDDFLVYSPLTYWFHAAWIKLVQPVVNWPLYDLMVLDYGSARISPDLGWLLFWLKLPYLIVDLICLRLLWILIKPSSRGWVVGLWALNLPLLHSAFMMGQFDILLVVFILAALVVNRRHPSLWAPVFIALAAGFKPFPLFMLPFLSGSKWKNILIGGLTYLAIISPYLASSGYRQYALLAQHTDKMWYAKIMVSGSQYLSLYLLGFSLGWGIMVLFPALLPAWGWLAWPLLWFYAVTHFHPQWFSWLSPFFILAWIIQPRSRPLLLILLICWLCILFSFETSLHFGLFNLDFSPLNLIIRWYSPDRLVSFIRSFLAATVLLLPVVWSGRSHESA